MHDIFGDAFFPTVDAYVSWSNGRRVGVSWYVQELSLEDEKVSIVQMLLGPIIRP